jgi:hypothetical protein
MGHGVVAGYRARGARVQDVARIPGVRGNGRHDRRSRVKVDTQLAACVSTRRVSEVKGYVAVRGVELVRILLVPSDYAAMIQLMT